MNMYKGSCLCGAIELTLDGGITDIIHCHCSLCRKSSGTAYATNGFVNVSELKVSDPNKQMTYFEVKKGMKRHFCKTCATPIFSSNAQNPDRYRIRLGVLDSDITERPSAHNFVTSKANWDDLDADLPRNDRYEPVRGK